jgi:hypothetical protein
MTSSGPRVPTIRESYQQLSYEAKTLNSASDEFTRSVRVLDEAICRLQVGVSVWVPFRSWGESPEYAACEIGYAKVNGEWGISIREIEGNEATDYEHVNQLWLFPDAPRELRLDSVEQLP